MKYKVKISRGAFATILMNGLETFLLPMKNAVRKGNYELAKGHEIFGYIFGTWERDEKPDRVTYKVDYVNFDATARTTQDYVEYIPHARELKEAVATMVNLDMTLLGNIHTHPYRLLENKTYTDEFFPDMYRPTPADEKSSGWWDFQLDLILTVVNAQKALTLPPQYAESNCENCIQFNIDNIRFFLAAYVRRGSNKFKYVPYIEVKLMRPEGMGKTAKQLDIDEELKEELFKIK